MKGLLPPQADVVVIGGGVIGASVAYHLSRKKVQVVLLEKNDFVSGASGACEGMILLQSKKPGVHLQAALASRRRFDTLPEEMGFEIEFRREGGMILIRNEAELQAMQRLVADQRRTGLNVDLLERGEAGELEPSLACDVMAFTHCPLDAQVNPVYLSLAFIRAARRHGAKLFSHTPVTAITLKHGAVHSIQTGQEKIETRVVVNAAGVHAPEIGKMVDLNIPITPRRGQVLVTEALPPLLTRCLVSARYIAAKYDPGLTGGENLIISIEQTGNGNFLLGSTREFVGFDMRTTPDAMKRIVSETTRIIPRLKDAHLIRAFAGLRPYTTDGLPILGKVDSLEGFIMASGHEGDGIALSPITGQLIAELIADGKTSIPLEPFALERFSLPEPS
jgi:glycine/D-amino acid oxidase-like deaminating enzyme